MIKLNEKYYLDSEPLNYTLKELKIIKNGENTGKERFETIGYYADIAQVFNKIIEKELQENIDLLNNIKELIKYMEEIKTQFSKYHK